MTSVIFIISRHQLFIEPEMYRFFKILYRTNVVSGSVLVLFPFNLFINDEEVAIQGISLYSHMTQSRVVL